MPINTTPDRIVVPSRDEQVAKYRRDYRLRDPSASLVVQEQVDVDARVLADQLLPILDASRSAGDALTLLNQTGKDLDNTWGPRGIPRLLATGASGYVKITASTGGGPIFLDDEIKDLDTGLRFRCLQTSLSYQDGDFVPIGGVDTGPLTNLAVGKRLTWSQPRPGIGPTAVIQEQGDGDGLVGGRDVELDSEYKDRIADYLANPPAAGNPADVMLKVEKAPGIPIQKAFVYPAILGSCTSAVAFLLKPSRAGASRLPTELQRGEVEALIKGLFPGGDIYYFPTILSQPEDLSLEVRWAKGATGWTDLVMWPPRYDVGAGQIVVSGTPSSATSFILRADDDDYTGVPSPQVNQTIGFYDADRRRFSRKRIASVTGTGPWTITCATALGASDTAYTPETGQPCCPWSDSLDLLVTPALNAFQALGPGEMVANVDFLLDGERQRRVPENPTSWPSSLSNKNLVGAFTPVTQIADLSFVQGDDAEPAVGVPGVTLYLITPGTLTAFPKAL
jgi:hypothetical protein